MSISFFLLTVILLNIMPGPAMLYVAHQTMDGDLRAGLLSIIGIELGTFLHILASILGLTILISKSTLVFMTIQYVSAAFLIYLGITQLVNNRQLLPRADQTLHAPTHHYGTLFKGTLINVLNPKIIIFFIALLPQFIDPYARDANLRVLILGSVFGLIGGLVNLAITFSVHKCMQRLIVHHPRCSNVMRWSTTTVSVAFILFGMSIMLIRIYKQMWGLG